MLYTKETVQANIRNREGKRVFYQEKGDRLTWDAKEYLIREGIEILPAQEAKPTRFLLYTGGYIEEKPEHMTHLDAQTLVHKRHPRIAFRGALDTLEAEILLCQQEVEEPLRHCLEEVLQLVRNLIRWDVLGEPVDAPLLCGMTASQLRQRSHRPQEFYGQPHFMPQATDRRTVLLLNRLRCTARNAELSAVHAFCDGEGLPIRLDILQTMNRISSFLYILMIQEKAR